MRKRIPKFIDLSALVDEFDPTCKGYADRLHADSFAYLIGTIYENEALAENNSEPIRLYSKYLERILGKQYVRYKEFLLQKGILEKLAPFEQGRVSYGFNIRYPKGYIYGFGWYKITSKNILKAIKEIAAEEADTLKYGYTHLVQNFTNGLLKMDIPLAVRLIRERLLKERIEIAEGRTVGESKMQGPDIPFIRAEYYLNMVKEFKRRRFNLQVDKTSQRFHSLLTRMPKFLRETVNYGGEPLICLDLKNSQAYILNALFKHETWRTHSGLSIPDLMPEYYHYWRCTSQKKKIEKLRMEELTEWERKDIEAIEGKDHTPNLMVITFSNILKTRAQYGFQVPAFPTQKKFFTDFASLSSKGGDLYLWLSNKFRGKFMDKHNRDRFATRDLAKQETLELLLYGNYHKYTLLKEDVEYFAPLRIFFAYFPVIGNMLLLLKTRPRLDRHGKQVGYHHQDCPILLQKLESELFLKKITRKLKKKGITPFFTIHDSIVTTANNEGIVKSIMEEILEEYVGLPPQIEVEPFREMKRKEAI